MAVMISNFLTNFCKKIFRRFWYFLLNSFSWDAFSALIISNSGSSYGNILHLILFYKLISFCSSSFCLASYCCQGGSTLVLQIINLEKSCDSPPSLSSSSLSSNASTTQGAMLVLLSRVRICSSSIQARKRRYLVFYSFFNNCIR